VFTARYGLYLYIKFRLSVLCGSENKQRLFPCLVFRRVQKLRISAISFVMSVRLSVSPSVRPSTWNNSIFTGRILMKFDIWVFLKNLPKKFKFHWNLTTITGTLHEDRYTFMPISRWIPLRMRNVSDKSCRENQNTHFMFNNLFFPENRAVYEIMWKIIAEPDIPRMTI